MKDVIGYEGVYSISKEGEVFSHFGNGRFLRTWKIGHGYKMVMLYKGDNKPRKFLVHRLVASAFIPNPSNKREVNHMNGDILDNRIENLEWVTSKENKQHAIKRGLYKNLMGSNHYKAKLTDNKVRKIRQLLKEGKMNQKQIAEMFNIGEMTISGIRHNREWKHVI